MSATKTKQRAYVLTDDELRWLVLAHRQQALAVLQGAEHAEEFSPARIMAGLALDHHESRLYAFNAELRRRGVTP